MLVAAAMDSDVPRCIALRASWPREGPTPRLHGGHLPGALASVHTRRPPERHARTARIERLQRSPHVFGDLRREQASRDRQSIGPIASRPG